ncbi:MAG: phosphoglycerate kinase [Patescibacteria group bacterium]
MQLKTIKQIKNLTNKRVIVRTDFNVPMKGIKIIDDYRIQKALPTIEYLIKQKAKIILLSHLGRPNGKVVKELSLLPIAQKLEKLLKKKVAFIPQISGEEVEQAIETLNGGEVLVLENVRFHPKEEANDSRWGKELAGLGDIFVNDAFAVSHRKQSSVVAIAKYLPSYAGLLLEDEITNLNQVLEPKKPAVAIVGGSKIETKIKVIDKLSKKFDQVLIGGAIANNFILSAGYEVGKSLVDKDFKLNLNKYNFEKIVLPVDVIVTGGKTREVDLVSKNEAIYDLGAETFKIFKIYLNGAKTIVWNGPMGWFEKHEFAKFTLKLASEILKNKTAQICIGGGETASLFMNKKLSPNIFVSTGGGAMLEFLEGKELPGIKVLEK